MTHDQTTATPGAAGTEASNAIGSVAADLQAAATRKFDDTVSEVRSQAHDARVSVAGEVNDVATALRHASEELRDGSAQERILGQIASTIADASDALRTRDIGEMFQSASKLARDNPAVFLGGAALLGFAASRFAKASGAGQPGRSDTTPPLKEKVDAFVNEGNPNTQPVGTAS